MAGDSTVRRYPGLGKRLNGLLYDRRLSRTDLARATRISRQTLSAASARDLISPKNARRVAEVLGVETEELLGITAAGGQWEPESDATADDGSGVGTTTAGRELEDFVASLDRIVRQLSSGSGTRLSAHAKIAILNGVAEAARLAGQQLPREFFDAIKRVGEEPAVADRER